MAKKSPTFNSDRAKAKWASLENQAGSSLTKIIEGKASVSDIQRVSSTISQLSTVAHTVFNEALDAAKETALAVQKAGQIEVRDGLTEFETALNNALKQSFQETQRAIIDVLEMDILEVEESINKSLGSGFEDIKSLLPPRDLPTINDLLANNELINEQTQVQLNKTAEEQSDNLLDSIYKMMSELMSNLKVRIPANALAAPGSKYIKGQRHVMNPYELRTFASRAQSFVGQDLEDAQAIPITEDASTSPMVVNMPTGSEEVVPISPDHSPDRMSDILDRLEAFLANQGPSSSPMFDDNSVDEQKHEQEKADTWWRSFSNWVGKGLDKQKSRVKGTLFDLLKSMGGLALLSMIFSPNLWKELGDSIEKYVTWDNIKGAAMTSWNWLEDKTSGIVDWVLDKFGLGKQKDPLKLAPSAQQQVESLPTKQQLTGLGGAETTANYILQQGGGDPFKLNERGQKLLDAADPATKKAFNDLKYSDFYLPQRLRSGFTTMGDWLSDAGHKLGGLNFGTITKVAPSNISNRSGLAPAATLDPGETIVNAPIKVTPGVAIQAPTSAPTGAQAKHSSPTPAVIGSPQVGLSSFKFHSGVDDHLILMNSSILGY